MRVSSDVVISECIYRMHTLALKAQMLQILSGLLPELHALRQVGLAPGTSSATSAIGYRQGLEWLDKVAAARHAPDEVIRDLALAIQAASRRLHKAQVTFHRDQPHFRWIDARQGIAGAAQEIEAHFLQPVHQGMPVTGHDFHWLQQSC